MVDFRSSEREKREGCSLLINTFLSTDVNAGDRIIAVGVCGKSSERRRRRAQINRGCASRREKTERFPPPPPLSIPYLGDLAKARFHYAHRIFMRTTFLDGRARGEERRKSRFVYACVPPDDVDEVFALSRRIRG